MELIGVIDCNNFFVSCERVFRPDLWQRPVVVLSSNDGCIVARSQEIKDNGIPMGVPYFQVKDTLDSLGTAVFSSNFPLYRDFSRRVFALVREHFALVEEYSIDEAFFTCTDTADLSNQLYALRARVLREVGIPVSIGVAETKTQAKFVNDKAKKTTDVLVLRRADWESCTPSIALRDIWGIGGRLLPRYYQLGLHTVADVLAADPTRIQAQFGIAGRRLQAELAGQVAYPVQMVRQYQKSLMSSRSFGVATTEYAMVADAVAFHVRHVAADLRTHGLLAPVIRVSIRPSRYGDYALRGGSLGAVLPEPTDDTGVLLEAAMTLLEALFESGVPYQKAGVLLSELLPQSQAVSLFKTERAERSRRLAAVVDRINQCVAGRELAALGRRVQQANWHSKRGAASPAYTTRWESIATARASVDHKRVNDRCTR